MNKIRNLFLLKNEGYNVPQFCIAEDENDSIIEQLDTCKMYAVRSVSDLEDGQKYSFAGIFETILNVPFSKIKSEIVRTRNSFNNASILRIYKEFSRSSTLKFIIQEMIDGDKSGTVFSMNPYTNLKEVVIEAVFGLNVGLTNGEIIPDTICVCENQIKYKVNLQFKKYVCDVVGGIKAENIELIDQSRRILNKDDIQELCFIIKKIEKLWGKPCQIEWTKKQDKLYVLQARDIVL